MKAPSLYREGAKRLREIKTKSKRLTGPPVLLTTRTGNEHNAETLSIDCRELLVSAENPRRFDWATS